MLDDPRAPGAPERVWRDWALVGVLAPTALVEAVFRTDLPWSWPTLALSLALLPTLLWRRTHPLLAVGAGFGAMCVLSIAQIVAEPTGSPGLYTNAAILFSLYALTRWGSGREVLIGAAIVFVTTTVTIVADFTSVGDAIGGYAVVAIVMLAGASVRFLNRARRRELEQVRSTERGQLARDLHDTVAHHVSAIAISAQAGIAVAPTRPEVALDALRVIEEEAVRTLAEMRAMVGTLRRDEPAELAPAPSLADVARLAGGGSGGGPTVEVRIDDDVGQVMPSTATTLFRLAQESITNARRHAPRATRIVVRLGGDADTIRLRVTDDGDPVTRQRAPGGYGIVGMMERADLLGGTCTAGPGDTSGWVVTAEIPRGEIARAGTPS